MASLGDKFPQSLKDQVVIGNLKIGSVFRLFVQNTNPPKIKRFIIVGESKDYVSFATVFINSEINTNVFPTKELQNLHLELDVTNRPYLDHLSFVDCSTIYVKSKAEIKDLYEKDLQCHKGDVSAIDFASIKALLSTSRKISPKQRKDYGL